MRSCINDTTGKGTNTGNGTAIGVTTSKAHRIGGGAELSRKLIRDLWR